MAEDKQLTAAAAGAQRPLAGRKMAAALWGLIAFQGLPANAQEGSTPVEATASSDVAQPAGEEETSSSAAADGRRADPRWHLVKEIARHFRVAEEHASEVVMAAFDAGERYQLPATVILGLIAVESDFRHYRQDRNGRRGVGLMQIHGHTHSRFAAGDSVPQPSIAEHVDLGARILRRYLELYRSLPRALQRYKGKLDRAPHYAQRILDWQSRFEAVLADPERRLVPPKLRVRKPLPA